MATPFKLRNGSLLVSTEAAGGIYNAAQLRKIAELMEASASVLKITEDQRIALMIPEDQAAQTTDALKTVGLGIRNYQDGLHQATACVGALCEYQEQDALSSAMDVTAELSDIVLSSPLKIGINGCARCCVPCHTLDIAVVGDPSGYRLSIGGKTSQLPELASFVAEGIPFQELPGMLKKVISWYRDQAQAQESLQQLIERLGLGPVIEMLAPYSQDAGGGEMSPMQDMTQEMSQDTPDSLPTLDDSTFPSLDTPSDSTIGLVGDDLSLETNLEVATEHDIVPVLDDRLLDPNLNAPQIDSIPNLEQTLAEVESLASDFSIPVSEPGLPGADLLDEPGLIEDVGNAGDMLKSETATLADPILDERIMFVDQPSASALEDKLDENPLRDIGSVDIDPSDFSKSNEDSLDIPISMAHDTGESMKDIAIQNTSADVLLEEIGTSAEAEYASLNSEVAGPTGVAPVAEEFSAVVEPDAELTSLTEAEESAFEEKFNEVLTEEAKFAPEDDADANLDQRNEALDLIESATPEDLPSPIVSEPEPSPQADALDSFNLEAGIAEEFDHSDSQDHSELDVRIGSDGMLELAPGVAESVAEEMSGMSHHEADVHPMPARSQSGTWDFQSVAMRDDGKISLQFINGAEIALDPKMIDLDAGKTISVGGQSITIYQDKGIVKVDIGGVEVTLPKSA